MEKHFKKGSIIYGELLNKILSDVDNKNINVNLICVPYFKDFGNTFENTSCNKSFKLLSNNLVNEKLNYIIPKRDFIESNNTDKIFPFGIWATHFNKNGYDQLIESIDPIFD